MNDNSIEEIREILTHLRQNPSTKRKFPLETWDAIIQLTKTYSHKKICQQLQLNPSLLKRKLKQRMAQAEFREISLTDISSETVSIELISKNGLQAKIQGPLSCLNCLPNLL